jgi:hypothetical protein
MGAANGEGEHTPVRRRLAIFPGPRSALIRALLYALISQLCLLILDVAEGFPASQRLIQLLSWENTGDGIQARCLTSVGDTLFLRADVYGVGILRLQLGKLLPMPESAILADRLAQRPPYRIFERREEVDLITAEIRLRLEIAPLRLAFHGSEGELLLEEPEGKGMWSGPRETGATFAIQKGEHFFGLGKPQLPLDLRGQIVEMRVQPGGGSRFQSAFLFSTRGYGIFLPSAVGCGFDIGGSSPEMLRLWQEQEHALDYFFIAGSSPEQVLTRYTQLVGRPPLQPPWVFGVWLFPSPGQDPAAVAEGFRLRGLPLDVVVPNLSAGRGSRGAERFDVRTRLQSLSLHAGWAYALEAPLVNGSRATADTSYPELAAEWWRACPASSDSAREPIVLLSRPEIYGPRWFFPFFWVEAVSNGITSAGGCPALVTDAGLAGVQRYALALQKASSRGWAGLSELVKSGLTAGLSGFGIWGPGGVEVPGEPSAELYIRSLQLNLLAPMAFLEGGVLGRPPWDYGEEALRSYRRLAGLRMQLLPYLFHLSVESHRTGLPVMRPLALYHPQDARSVSADHEYLLGRDLLIAPVVDSSGFGDGTVVMPIYLPEGQWYDFWSHLLFRGPRELSYKADLGRCPIFVRAGAVLPQGMRVSSVREMGWDPLWFCLYPGEGEEGWDVWYPASSDACAGLLRKHLWVSWGDTVRIRLEPLKTEEGRTVAPRGTLLCVQEFEAAEVQVGASACPELEDPSLADGKRFGWALRRAHGDETLISIPASVGRKVVEILLVRKR